MIKKYIFSGIIGSLLTVNILQGYLLLKHSINLTTADKAAFQTWASNRKYTDGSPAIIINSVDAAQDAFVVPAVVTTKGAPAHKDQSGADVGAGPDIQQNVYIVFNQDHVLLDVIPKN